ncbi:hypothetical protein [Nonomuraea sp. NPDC050786]|uniref:hypothetical protein n=1 Tax=Nonomuraea sp. NPDC050786 TaxID=3154840 RepID=UPI0033ECC0C0
MNTRSRPASPDAPLPARIARAAAAGLLPMAAFIATYLAAPVLYAVVGLGEPAMMALLVALPGAVSWASLHLFRVRPAWPVAIIGALFVVALLGPAYVVAVLLSERLSFFAWGVFLLVGVIAYAAAALVASARSRVVRAVVPLALLAVVYWLT